MSAWGYTGDCGPENWHKNFPNAGGKRQSPIDIITADTEYSPKLGESPLNIVYDPKRSSKLVNNGVTFRVDIDACDHNLSGGPLDENYQLVQFHAHWGSKDEAGAEHTFNGKQYAAEIHLVHWNKDKFNSVGEAIQNDRGIAVLGSFLKVGEKANPGFDKLIPFLKQAPNKNSEAVIDQFDPRSLLPANVSDYYTYEGSLTTPPCYESVTFILFKDIIEVSKEQIAALRDLLCYCCGETPEGHGKLVDNYRPLCPLNGRVVKASFQQ